MSKFYNEEQMRKAIDLARARKSRNSNFVYNNPDKILEEFTPIELPTDEEIEEASTTVLMGKYPYHPPKDCGYWKDMFREGVKWVVNKIKNANEPPQEDQTEETD